MAETATDIRTLIRADASDPDRAAVAHVLVSTGFLALGAVLAAVTLVSMAFPAALPLGYGVFRATTLLSLVVGFAITSLVGGAYYVLPRLTGAPLWNENLARIGLVLTSVATAGGMLAVGVGLGDGREPFGIPWWLDIVLLAGLSVPVLVSFQTVRARTESQTYVTVPYLLTGLVALPAFYVVGNLPGLTSVATTLGDFFAGSALIVATVAVAIGLLYYAVVKEGDRPLAGRQLATVGYWSVLFGAGWFGVAQLAGGPFADWLPAISAVLGLGLPVGIVATLANVVATTDGSWSEEGGPSPVVRTAVMGLVLATVITALAAAAGFRSTAALVALTPFWEGIVFSLVLGAIPLLISAWTYQAIPRMMGRSLVTDRIGQQVRLTMFGTVAFLGLTTLAGLTIGFGWAGGAFTGAYTSVGEGWQSAVGAGQAFLGLAIIGGLAAVLGNLAMASTIFRTITQGHVTTQEVLVEYAEEAADDE